jgi:FMN reductase
VKDGLDVAMKRKPYIVALGGTLRANSSTEKAVALVLRSLEARGAEVRFFKGKDLDLPYYNPELPKRTAQAMQLIEQVRKADGLILATPSYHGGISGYVKNAIDYLEDLRDDTSAYLAGKPVGCIVSASGSQASVSTLVSLRSIVHALRGWPTPLGLAINTTQEPFNVDGSNRLQAISDRASIMGGEILEFVNARLTATVQAALTVERAAQ